MLQTKTFLIMKNLFVQTIVLTALLLSPLTQGQDFYGTATYQRKLNLPELDLTEDQTQDIPEDMQDLIKEQLKKAGQDTYTLTFSKTASLYEKNEKPALAPDINNNDINSNVRIQFNSSGSALNKTRHYTNLKDKITVRETQSLDKAFLITDSIRKHPWVLSNQTKKIGEYTCYKATYTIPANKITVMGATMDKEPEDLTVTAWYTRDIPVQFGPAEYGGLPGLILELQDGYQSILCSKIVLNPKDRPAIEAPRKGKKVTQEQYMKILMEKQQEMQKRFSNSQNGTYIQITRE